MKEKARRSRIRRGSRARRRPTPTWRASGPATSARSGTRCCATWPSIAQLGIGDTARLLALANLAAADAGIGVWDSKIHYDFWRPITAIHNGDVDGNSQTTGDAELETRSSRAASVAQNPPYPDYVSGANGLTGAYTAMLQLFFQTDNLPSRFTRLRRRQWRSARRRGCSARSRTRPRKSSMRACCSGSTSASRYGGADARHARRVAHVHERVAADAHNWYDKDSKD